MFSCIRSFFSKFFLNFVFGVLNVLFLTTSLSTISLKFFKSTGTVFKLPKSKSSTFVLRLFKLVGTLTGLLITSLSTSAFKAITYFLAAKLDVSTPIALSNSFLVAKFV